MPTQLKIIADDYSPNQASDVGISAPFTVNFQAPIVISPGQKIAMDKFVAVIPDITANFALDTSKFTLWYSLNSINNQSVEITLPARNYKNLSDLLNVMYILSNNAFSGFTINTEPQTPSGNFSFYRDRGLKMICGSTAGKFSMEYATSPFPVLVLNPDGLALNGYNYFYPDAAGSWTLIQSDDTVVMTHGGGCMLQFQIDIPTAINAQVEGSSFYCGLSDNAGSIIGFYQNAQGILYLRNAANDLSTPLNIGDFPHGSTCQIYQANGYFQLRCFTPDEDGLEIEHFNTAGALSQSLGSVSYTTNYQFRASGSKTQLITIYPSINEVVNMTKDVAYGATQQQFIRTVALDFSQSGGLRAGLSVPDGLLLFTPQNSDFGSYLGSAAMNLSKINSSFDLALEILDIPLLTFQGNSSRNQLGTRQNVICYFRPEHSNVGTNTYIYDSLAYQWLDIAITYPVNLSSLSFRVYNPTNGQNLIASSLTFNLIINDKEY
tara:strand:- start:2746 stop:4221 length:1476 start_codon:yes stop_codon:yes gene_type:complete